VLVHRGTTLSNRTFTQRVRRKFADAIAHHAAQDRKRQRAIIIAAEIVEQRATSSQFARRRRDRWQPERLPLQLLAAEKRRAAKILRTITAWRIDNRR
jgi:hypothetical protein